MLSEVIKGILDRELAEVQADPKEPKCLRKDVFCGFHSIISPEIILAGGRNGPSVGTCTNVVGNCGCCHAETRAVVDLMVLMSRQETKMAMPMMFVTCSYAPCTNCANLLLEVGKIVNICGIACLYHTEHDRRGEENLRKVFPVAVFQDQQEFNDDTFAKWELLNQLSQ